MCLCGALKSAVNECVRQLLVRWLWTGAFMGVKEECGVFVGRGIGIALLVGEMTCCLLGGCGWVC